MSRRLLTLSPFVPMESTFLALSPSGWGVCARPGGTLTFFVPAFGGLWSLRSIFFMSTSLFSIASVVCTSERTKRCKVDKRSLKFSISFQRPAITVS